MKSSIWLRLVIATTVMLITNVLLELLFEGNITSIQANPVKPLFTALITGIAIVIGQELVKEMQENQQ